MNYFEYFSEIEQRFSQRRGSILLLSTLDWALIETWREAGIPLAAVLRGIDTAFDKHDARAQRSRGRLRKVNGLAWCAQAVMQATEEMMDAATGASPSSSPGEAGLSAARETGFEAERVAAYLDRNAQAIHAAINAAAINLGGVAAPVHDSAASSLRQSRPEAESWASTATTTAQRLRELAATMRGAPLPADGVRPGPMALDELDRTLTVLEERLFAVLQSSAAEEEMVDLKAQADRELAPYRARISTVQLRQVQQQFLQKRLLERRGLPRLSLFYMGHDD